jgi:hypothetical protein
VTILDEKIKDLTADNIFLRGIVAYLLSRTLPNKQARIDALEDIFTALKPEIEAHLKKYQNMSPQAGQKELDRIRRHCGDIVSLSDNF